MTTVARSSAAKKQFWDVLRAHQKSVRRMQVRDQFASDPMRARNFSVHLGKLLVDFSKHRITGETLELLLGLAHASDLPLHVDDLFRGERVNLSERRPALHTALRAVPPQQVFVDGTDVVPAIRHELQRMARLVRDLRAGSMTGAGGRTYTDIVNIGIGGSDLGPRLAVEALRGVAAGEPRIHFVANIDDQDLFPQLETLDPGRTLFVVASKSFTTQETLTNAESAKQWLQDHGIADPMRQFVAVTANPRAAAGFGISADRTLLFEDWVGGRYSIWSAVGFTLALTVGDDGFQEFLAGARWMDEHFRNAPLRDNAPVVLALLDVWYTNFWDAETLAVVPYDQRLRLLPDYLGQLMMESNGKRVDRNGRALRHATAPIVWGAAGTPAQHAFFQLLHQGTHLVPVDFLAAVRHRFSERHHRLLLANCFAQSRALMTGRGTRREAHRNFPGNQPSTTLLYEDLTPFMLGALLALYEHRTFVQSVIWQNNPFDQWGVELGKEMAGQIHAASGNELPADTDGSTRQLLEFCRLPEDRGRR